MLGVKLSEIERHAKSFNFLNSIVPVKFSAGTISAIRNGQIYEILVLSRDKCV